jgi:O-antigen/teichoic acid export membrane protein
MLIGFALAQALPLLASPLLTRLYTPEAFGLQALFISWSAALGVLATLRLDLAIVLSTTRREAGFIAGLAFLQASVITFLTVASIALFAPAIFEPQSPGGTWVWLLGPMVFTMALVQIAGGLLTWQKHFGPTSRAQVINQLGYLAIALGLGFAAAPTEGLVGAKLAGQILAVSALLFVLRGIFQDIKLPPRAEWEVLWARCRPFLLFNTSYSLIGVFGREVPIFAFSAVAATSAAGFYGLARVLLGAPATLLAASLSQVYYREAAEHRGTARLQSLTIGLLRLTMRATAPAFAFLMVWGDVVFALLFGRGWETAGQYAMILAFATWLGIQTAWPERLYESVGKQGVSFSIQLTFDAVAAIVVFTAVLNGVPHIAAVGLFAGVNTMFHLTYLTGMFRVAGIPLSLLRSTLGGGLVVFFLSLLLMVALRFSGLPEEFGVFGAGALGVSICAALGFIGYQSIKSALTGPH